MLPLGSPKSDVLVLVGGVTVFVVGVFAGLLVLVDLFAPSMKILTAVISLV